MAKWIFFALALLFLAWHCDWDLSDREFLAGLGSVGLIALAVGKTERRREEELRHVEESQGRGAALRWDAARDIWDRAKIERIRHEIEELEGAEAADEFAREIEIARADVPKWQRPLGWPLTLVVIGCIVLIALLVVLFSLNLIDY